MKAPGRALVRAGRAEEQGGAGPLRRHRVPHEVQVRREHRRERVLRPDREVDAGRARRERAQPVERTRDVARGAPPRDGGRVLHEEDAERAGRGRRARREPHAARAVRARRRRGPGREEPDGGGGGDGRAPPLAGAARRARRLRERAVREGEREGHGEGAAGGRELRERRHREQRVRDEEPGETRERERARELGGGEGTRHPERRGERAVPRGVAREQREEGEGARAEELPHDEGHRKRRPGSEAVVGLGAGGPGGGRRERGGDGASEPAEEHAAAERRAAPGAQEGHEGDEGQGPGAGPRLRRGVEDARRAGRRRARGALRSHGGRLYACRLAAAPRWRGREVGRMRIGRGPAVAALALACAALAALVAADSLRLVGRPFPGFLVWDNGTLVALHTAEWTGPRAGLPLNGGRVVAVDGAPFAGGRALLERVAAAGPGALHELRVRSRGEERSVRVASMRFGWGDWFATFGNYLFNSLFFFAIGLVALALRPDLAAARALATSMLLFGLLMVLAIDFVSAWRLVPLCQLVEAATPAAFAGLALVFPVERLDRALRRRVTAALWVGFLAVGAANAWLFRREPELARDLTSAVYLSIAAVAIAMLASLAHALRRGPDVRQRVQAAVVFAGALVAFLFPSLAVLAFFPLGWSFSFTWVTSLLLFFPLSILYAIVRYDLLGAERFIRVTTGYAVASGAVLLAYATLATLLDRLVAPGAARGPASSFVLLLGIAIAFDPIRRRTQRTVDRVFYRSVVDLGRVLEELGSELATLQDEAAIRAAAPARLRRRAEPRVGRLRAGRGARARRARPPRARRLPGRSARRAPRRPEALGRAVERGGARARARHRRAARPRAPKRSLPRGAARDAGGAACGASGSR